MKVEMLDIENVIRREIDSKCKQKTIALTYAFALFASYEVDFGKINKMIIERWSLSGLESIKKKAWKLYEEKCGR